MPQPETPEMIESVLAKAGLELTFSGTPNFIVRALPGFSLDRMYRGETSPYTVPLQSFVFHIAAVDKHLVVPGAQFSLSDRSFIHSFAVKYLNPDLTGWYQFSADYLGETSV